MKKFLSILLVLLLVLSLVACGQDTVSDDDSDEDTKVTEKKNGETTGTGGVSPESTGGSETTENGNEQIPGGNGDTTNSGDENTTKTISTDIIYDGEEYEIKWTETEASKGTIEFSSVFKVTAEQAEQVGLTGALSVKETSKFTMTFTKTAGEYIAEGNISSVYSVVSGQSAATFIDMMKQSLGDSKLDEMTRKVLDGEVLSSKEDIENYTWKYDEKFKIKFTVNGDKLEVTEFEETYQEWGTMTNIKNVHHVQNGVVRTVEQYENGELDNISTFRANGTQEKCTHYYEGEVSLVEDYDENGDLIENLESGMTPA